MNANAASRTQHHNRIAACLAVLSGMYMFGPAPVRAAVTPAITGVTTNFAVTPSTITIAGRYFGAVTPTVTLDGTVLVVATYTQTQVTALLPSNIDPGTYQLVLTNHSLDQQVSFDATIGAVGPDGPAGPAGPTGAAGPAGPAGSSGPQGPQGPSGPAGANGATGPMGSAGLTGPQGPQGVAGPAGPTGQQGMTWQGLWNISATYNLNDAVSFNGSSYISLIANNTGNEPDTAPSAWSLVASVGAAGPAGAAGAPGATGPQGPQGLTGATGPIGLTGPQGPQGATGATGQTGPQGMTWQGLWNISKTYALNDAVTYNGSSYISLIANNTGNEPDTAPGDWSVVASVGAAGPAGPTGPTGATGATGNTGATGAQGPAGPTGPQGPAGPTNIYFTSPNSNGTPIQITTSNEFYTIATLTLPAGSYLIQGKVVMANFNSSANVETVCELVGGSIGDAYALSDLNPDTSGVGIWSQTLPLMTIANLAATTSITMQCEAAPSPYVYVYYPQMSAIPVTTITVQ